MKVPIPLSAYEGLNSIGALVDFRLTSIDLVNSLAWPEVNFYKGYIGISGEKSIYIDVECNGPKTGVAF